MTGLAITNVPQSIGTWTPADASGASLVFTGVSAGYTRIGNMVFAYCQLTFPTTVSGSAVAISGLPFASAAQNYAQTPGAILTNASLAFAPVTFVGNGASSVVIRNGQSNAAVTNVQLTGAVLVLQMIYPVT